MKKKVYYAKSITLRIPKQQWEEIEKCVSQSKIRSASMFVRLAIERYIMEFQKY